VYLDYPAYGISVPSLSAAHALIEAVTQPQYTPNRETLSQLVALVAVMRAQRRPALLSELGPAASFMAALAHPDMRSPASLRVFRAMLPGFKALVIAAPAAPGKATAPERAAHASLARATSAIQKQLAADGIHDSLWLWDYRAVNDLHRDPHNGRYEEHPHAVQRKAEFLIEQAAYEKDAEDVRKRLETADGATRVYTLPVTLGPELDLAAVQKDGWKELASLDGKEKEEALERTAWIMRVQRLHQRKTVKEAKRLAAEERQIEIQL
jgi:hypothetical protein